MKNGKEMIFDGRALINGRRVAAADGQLFDCISPVDGRVLTQVARCGAADIDSAVSAARTAFDDKRWRGKAPAQRKRIMLRFDMDKQLTLARNAKTKGDWGNAQAAMLEAAQNLRRMGFEQDQVSVLRDMTLEPTVGQAPEAQQYVQAGQRAMAEYYYKRYLDTKPRDAQWLLEALAWGNAAGDEVLLKRFAARVPDKEHENIDERGRLRGIELKVDDALYLAFERIRLDKGEAVSSLQN